MENSFRNPMNRAGQAIEDLERWIVVILLGFTIGFALLQIILRNIFSTGVVWGDTFLRHSVLWIGLLGAARATAENKHIRIDVLTRVLPAAILPAARIFSTLVSLSVSAILCYASVTFVQNERISGYIAFAGIPLWWLEIIFPLTFALMTIRFGRQVFEPPTPGGGEA
jgi:TRAP-type C4-dicarboxylate transport system permease small subunit